MQYTLLLFDGIILIGSSHSPSNEVKYGRVSFGLVFCFENGRNTCVISQKPWEESKTVSHEPEELHTKGLSDRNMSE